MHHCTDTRPAHEMARTADAPPAPEERDEKRAARAHPPSALDAPPPPSPLVSTLVLARLASRRRRRRGSRVSAPRCASVSSRRASTLSRAPTSNCEPPTRRSFVPTRSCGRIDATHARAAAPPQGTLACAEREDELSRRETVPPITPGAAARSTAWWRLPRVPTPVRRTRRADDTRTEMCTVTRGANAESDEAAG